LLQQNELTKPLKISHGMFLTTEILRTFFKGFSPGEDKYRLFFWTLLETGLRLKEACAMQEQDFTNDFKELMAVTCKNPHLRYISLSPMLASSLKQWCDLNRKRFHDGYIWPVPNNLHKHLQQFQVQSFMQKKRKQLGLDVPVKKVLYKNKPNGFGLREQCYYALSSHSFRRFYETNLTNLSGGNFMLIASIMQYDDPAIVRKYYDDSQARTMQQVLSEEYHQRITSQLVQGRPVLSKQQQTLKKYDADALPMPKSIYSKLKKYA